ncbi:YihY/virulence factor BrkB family protein [Maricaulis sp. CAU 1757]
MTSALSAAFTVHSFAALRRAAQQTARDNLSFVAGGVAFFGFLAVFPALGALVMIWGLFADPQSLADQLAVLRQAMPAAAFDLIEAQLVAVAESRSSSLTLGAILALAFSFWSAAKGARAMIAAMNIAYAQTDQRGFIKANLTALAFTVGGIVYAVLSLALIAALPPLLEAIRLGVWVEVLIHAGRWLAAIALFILALGALYRWAPHRRPPAVKWITPGAVLAAGLWIIASLAFSFYAANIADYNASFGALGSVVALMMWMWLSSFIICFGAVYNAVLEPGVRDAGPAGAKKQARHEGRA